MRLRTAADRLLARVGHWTPARWASPAFPPVGVEVTDSTPRGEIVHGLAQRLADLTADAEGQPHRAVPRLDNDLALPDQVRVMVADLLGTDAPDEALDTAADAIEATAHRL